MTMRAKGLALTVWTRTLLSLTMATAIVSAQSQTPNPPSRPPIPSQTPSRPAPAKAPSQSQPVFRSTTDLIQIKVVPRDAKGKFVPTLSQDDFVVLEDGVEQKVTAFVRANGGQFYNSFASTAPIKTEGLVLPKMAPPPDTAGRIWIIFIDDLHFKASQTPIVREMLKQVRDTLVHDNDLVGFVSSGYSSIEMNPAYDYRHRRFDEVINKVMGGMPSTEDIIRMQAGQDGMSELNHNVAVAFQAAYNLLTQLEDVRNKVKGFIWISNGYSLDPFKDSRLKRELERYTQAGACDSEAEQDPEPFTEDPRAANDPCRYVDADMAQIQNVRIAEGGAGFNLLGRSTLQWKEADLMSEMSQLIRSAKRANTMFFMFDPRGLMAGMNDASMQQPLSNQEETLYMNQTVDSLRALAENTGGLACVRTNDCKKIMQQIDNMTSDYYMLGYSTSNPDPFRLGRKIEIKVKRPGVELVGNRDYQDTYYLKRPKTK